MVKRYDLGMTNAPAEYQSPTMHLDSNGGYVSYEEYSALEAKCAALAAENAGLNEKMNKLATWPGIEFYSSAWEFNGGDGDTALEFMCGVQTPATDAFLAEVRASAVDGAVGTIMVHMNHQHVAVAEALHILRTHAAQLRQEAAQ